VDVLARLVEQPERAALFFDVDGVLAPIVPRPEDAYVPEQTRAELRRLASRYGLVACVSGRTSAGAREIVGLEELVYVGEHGLELDPDAANWRSQLRAFADTVEWPVEDKGLTLSYHYRNAADEEAAEQTLLAVAERARDGGLVPRFGRKVLEIRPPVATNKGTAVRSLLEQSALRRALYAGDDTTDLDAFRALDDEGLELAVKVAVASAESPKGLGESADVVVGTPAELLETVLRRL
jgi:trehalose 6-phosphate phosphatase